MVECWSSRLTSLPVQAKKDRQNSLSQNKKFSFFTCVHNCLDFSLG